MGLRGMVTFVYIDETGPVGTNLSKQPQLRLAAVLVPEDRVMPLAERLRALAMQHLGWVPQDFEWHGQELWNGIGFWKDKTPPELLAAYADAIHLLDELDLQVSHATINKPELKLKYNGQADANAYRLALQFLLEKLDRNVPGLKLIIADEAKEQQVYAQKMLTGMQQWHWSGEVPARKLTTVVDSLHFIRSDTSPGIQLADLVAYILQKVRRGANHPDAQAALEAMSATIRNRQPTWREPWPS